MGMQITIKAKDMLNAGWKVQHTVQPDRLVDLGEGGYPEIVKGDAWSTWSRPADGAEIRTYHTPSGDFLADCRPGAPMRSCFRG